MMPMISLVMGHTFAQITADDVREAIAQLMTSDHRPRESHHTKRPNSSAAEMRVLQSPRIKGR